MNSNLKLFFSLIAGAPLIFSACSNEEDLPVENISIVQEGNVKPAQLVESSHPTAILGSAGSLSSAISQTFTNVVDVAKARHIVVACADLETYKDDIIAAYQRGSVITVTDPDTDILDQWCTANGMIYAGDPSSSDNCAIVSFNRKASSISIQKGKQRDGIDEEEVPLVIFTGWLDKIFDKNLMGSDLKSRDLKKRISPQHVSHVFSLDLSREVLDKTNWVIPEDASLSTTAELNCDIYQLHSFADNASFSGDIYAVEADITIHNGNLYNGRWQYNKGKSLYEVCGFYLSECWVTAALQEKENRDLKNSTSHQFVGGPAPATTDLSTPYQSGFEWSFDGWISGGNGLESSTPIPLQEGGWTWNNLKEIDDVKCLDILNDSNNGIASWGLRIYPMPSERESMIPDIATGDLTFHCSWIWAVPQAKDDSTDRYYMKVNLIPKYLWHKSIQQSNKIESDYIYPAVDNSCTFMLIPPSRKEGQRVNI